MAKSTPPTESKGAPSRSRGPVLADEQSDELPALLAIAVGIAVIFVILVPPAVSITEYSPASAPLPAHTVDPSTSTSTSIEQSEPTDTAVEARVDANLMSQQMSDAGLPKVSLEVNDSVVSVGGAVSSDEHRQAVVDFLASQPGVSKVVDDLTIAPLQEGTVAIAASQAGIVLSGKVPSQAFIDELVDRASKFYFPDQIDATQLISDPSVSTPISLSVAGLVADDVLNSLLSKAFVGIVGIDDVDTSQLIPSEYSPLGVALNNLRPIEFVSGSAVILPESEETLAEIAVILAEFPAARVEVGTHTDSSGSDRSNSELSQARSESIVASLIGLGVTNELVPRGFGETRLRYLSDASPNQQLENRRVEFRVIS